MTCSVTTRPSSAGLCALTSPALAASVRPQRTADAAAPHASYPVITSAGFVCGRLRQRPQKSPTFLREYCECCRLA
jgi:hypothetical protein